jgi:hypothetical protein
MRTVLLFSSILIAAGTLESICASPERKEPTHHWHDPAVEISIQKNDLDAFKDLQIWLTGSSDEDFNFE